MFAPLLLALLTPAEPPAAPTDLPKAKAYVLVAQDLPEPRAMREHERAQVISTLRSFVTLAPTFPRALSRAEVPALRPNEVVVAYGACPVTEALEWAVVLRPLAPRFRLVPIDAWPEGTWPCPKWVADWSLHRWLDTSDGALTVTLLWFRRTTPPGEGTSHRGGLGGDEGAVVVWRKDGELERRPPKLDVYTHPERIENVTAGPGGIRVERLAFFPSCLELYGADARLTLSRSARIYEPTRSADNDRVRVAEDATRAPVMEIPCPVGSTSRVSPAERDAANKALMERLRRTLDVVERARAQKQAEDAKK